MGSCSRWRAASVAGLIAMLTAAVIGGLTPSPVRAQLAGGAAATDQSTPQAASAISPPLAVAWVFSMGPEPRNLLAPKVVGDRVFVSHDGKLHCLDARTGAEQWKLESKEARVTTSPVPVGGVIVVGTDQGDLMGLNPADGKEVWKTTCSGPISPDPLVFGLPEDSPQGEVLILGAREMVYGIDPVKGVPRWVSSLTSPVSRGPITDGAGVYFLCQNGSVQSIDPVKGRFRWNSQTLFGPQALPPVMADGRVIVASSNTMMAVARSGAISWTRDMPAGIGARPTVIGDTMYVPCVDGVVYTLFSRSGRDQRRKSISLKAALTAPVALDGDLMVLGTSSALVNLVDMKSGEVKWQFRCRAPDQPLGQAAEYGIYAPFAVSGSALYCVTGDGDLYCFSATAVDGVAPRFSDLIPGPGSAQPGGKEAVDLSFVVTDDGSGVDPTSLAVTVDGTAIKVKFDPANGKGEAHFPSLPDGSHIVKATAKDYRGNEGSVRWSFLTDKIIRPPEEQPGTPGAPGTTPGRTTTRSTATTRRGGTTTRRGG
jgi:outer membrane protein assembly factor BamB